MSKPEGISFPYYVARRALLAIPLVFGAIVVNFALITLAPGDPAVMIAGERATPGILALIRSKYGLDQPLPIRLLAYIWVILHGDLGYSYSQQTRVIDLIMQRLPNTLLLMGAALILAYGTAIILAVKASTKPYSWQDNVISLIALSAYSTPWFWLGIMLITIFAVIIPVFPIGGMTTYGGSTNPLDVAYHLVLPAVAYAAQYMGMTLRLTRSTMLETLRMDFITFARSKGISERKVVYGHALKNAMLVPVTVMGVQIGIAFGGAVVIETVFGWPGIGRLVWQALLDRDYPVMMGVFTLMSVFTISASFVVDVLYAFLDPRIRYQK